MAGGPTSNWGLDGRIRARDLVWIGRVTSRGLPVECHSTLFRAALIEMVTDYAHALYLHQVRPRIRWLFEGKQVFMLRGPTLRKTGPSCGQNYVLLENAPESTAEVCGIVAKFIIHAMSSPDDVLPIVIPMIFAGERVRKHESGNVVSSGRSNM